MKLETSKSADLKLETAVRPMKLETKFFINNQKFLNNGNNQTNRHWPKDYRYR